MECFTCLHLSQNGAEPETLMHNYRISSLIRLCFAFQNNPKNLDPSYKTDLDLWDCLGRINLIVKFNRTDLVICIYSREDKPHLIAK